MDDKSIRPISPSPAGLKYKSGQPGTDDNRVRRKKKKGNKHEQKPEQGKIFDDYA